MKRLLLSVLVATSFASVVHAKPDQEVVIEPVTNLFAETALGAESSIQQLSIKNLSSDTPFSISQAFISGPNADEYRIKGTDCTNVVAPNTSCNVDVVFAPITAGSKLATVKLVTSDEESPEIAAFLQSEESYENQAERRLPAILQATDVGTSVTEGDTVTWSILGYQDGYESYFALFDCNNISAGECGESFDSNIFVSTEDTPASEGVISSQEVWTYRGEAAQVFTYSARLPNNLNSSNDLVLRFYHKSLNDAAANEGSMSLLVPGNLGVNYYGNDGRRIQLQLLPKVN